MPARTPGSGGSGPTAGSAVSPLTRTSVPASLIRARPKTRPVARPRRKRPRPPSRPIDDPRRTGRRPSHPDARMLSKTWLPALALTTGLLLGASTTALTQTPPPRQTPTQRPGGRHPHIVAAERALKHAERQLEEAA